MTRLVVCESSVAVTTHVREVADIALNLSGFHLRPVSLCGTEIAWDTQLPIGSARCRDCVAVAAMAIGVPAQRCPYCGGVDETLPSGSRCLLHSERCKVNAIGFCASCVAPVQLRNTIPVAGPRMTFWCRTCVEEHPRSGRYSFVGGDRSGPAVVGGGRDGNGNRQRGAGG